MWSPKWDTILHHTSILAVETRYLATSIIFIYSWTAECDSCYGKSVFNFLDPSKNAYPECQWISLTNREIIVTTRRILARVPTDFLASVCEVGVG